ncbi:PTS sugar transporter subunit IIB [Clostridium sp. MSJ-4]|uniref:PTS sugar transporter subunit IIB n=1 Tax=Clostridium simiarum TaxID=2841506 RepID=A0ABS6EZ91_9CLOT|nr:PTS sugar transporter subunit IIB [Clostridium simiarum]MBU5591554.1 PTS sugar transporter subunit IIB [Clostridium simiarum]
MIKLLRIDDKLLHGQVAFSWVRNLKIHTIIIADDKVAYDEFSKMTLGLSKPTGVNLIIVEVDEAIELLKSHVNSGMNVMAIVSSIDNAYRIIYNIPEIKSLNLGVLRKNYNSVSLTHDIAINENEAKLCKEILDKSVEIEIRLTYDDEKLFLSDLIKE